MNIKTLAFETNPVNEGFALNSFDLNNNFNNNKEGSFIKQIEERLRDRAGNPKYETNLRKQEDSKTKKLGTSITKDEVDRIIKEFNS